MSEYSSFEEEIEKHGELFYRNVGTSMRPLIRQGKDLMVIVKKPEGRLKKYDVPLYKRDSGKYILHRILKVRKDDYVICGDNCYRREYGITDRHIIGVLSAVIRNGNGAKRREVTVESRGYRFYVHLWCDLFFLRAACLFALSLPRRVWHKIRRKRRTGGDRTE